MPIAIKDDVDVAGTTTAWGSAANDVVKEHDAAVVTRVRDAGAILTNHSGRPFLPRWVAYMNVWAGLLYFPAALLLFFKRGAFAYNGLLALYVPLAAFLIWIVLMTQQLIRSIKADMPSESSAGTPGHDAHRVLGGMHHRELTWERISPM